MTGLEVFSFRRGPFWNFSYMVACRRTAQAVVIDPAWDVDAVLAAASARGLTIGAILLTHGHSDHVNGVADLAGTTGARAFIHTLERESLQAYCPGEVVEFEWREEWQLGDFLLQMEPSAGHSPGSTSFLVEGHVFTGDTLHVGGVGRPGSEPGAVERLWESTQELAALHPATILHPGHDEGSTPTSTIGEEVARAPALRARTFEEFVVAMERATGRRLR